MKKIAFGLLALILVMGLCGGCLPSNATPTEPVDNNPPNSTPVFDNPPPEGVTWISPGKVNVANFYPGARAEYPLTIHNGRQQVTEEGEPTGVFLETQFVVEFKYPDHVGEGYSKPLPEVQDWVIVAEMTPVLAPRETRDIMVVLVMPEDASEWSIPVWNLTEEGKRVQGELQDEYLEAIETATRNQQPLPEKPLLLAFLDDVYGREVGEVLIPVGYENYVAPTDGKKWEFWVSVSDASQSGMVKTAMATRWIVDMRSS